MEKVTSAQFGQEIQIRGFPLSLPDTPGIPRHQSDAGDPPLRIHISGISLDHLDVIAVMCHSSIFPCRGQQAGVCCSLFIRHLLHLKINECIGHIYTFPNQSQINNIYHIPKQINVYPSKIIMNIYTYPNPFDHIPIIYVIYRREYLSELYPDPPRYSRKNRPTGRFV